MLFNNNIEVEKLLKKKENNNLVISFSGGLDTTSLLIKAKKENRFNKIACVSIDYGQSNRKELEAAAKIAKDFEVNDFRIIDATFIQKLSKDNFLAGTSNKIVNADGLSDMEMAALENKDIRAMEKRFEEGNTFVPMRNFFFIGLVAAYAYNEGYNNIGIGAVKNEYCADGEKPFLKLLEKTINRGLPKNKRNLKLYTPFTNKEKWDILEEIDKLGYLEYVIYKTVSCDRGLYGLGCGTCPSCLERKEAILRYLNKTKRTLGENNEIIYR